MMSGSSFTVLLLFVGLQCICCTSENITYEYLRIRRQNIDNGFSCKLPQHPNNGRWTLINGSARPGDEVSKNSILKFECDPGYKLSPNNSLLACDVNWTSNVPVCEKKCPAKYSTQTTTIKCENKLGHEIPCDEAVDGTYLTYSCIPFYETPLGYKKSILCVDGTWNFPNPVCQPACGKRIDKDTIQLVVGGIKNDKREYPWIVAVFQKIKNEYSNICGGTLISQRVVITAAHCVTNNYGDGLSPTEFLVGVGKYYTKFQDPRDVGAQYIDVARIVVNPAYKGASQRFFADIALLITKDLVVFNEVIQPVCYQDLPSIHLQAGKIGVIAGWGATESGEQPDELRTLEIPYKYETTCSQELPSDWADRYNTVDKICAGFFNKTKSVCTGDSGSGLYFKNPDNNRYYIHGIVSIAPAEKENCNFQQNALYTKVAFYYEFVDREATRQYVEQCTLPAYPCNGKWIVPNQNKNPGDIVPSNTILKVECNQGYELTANSAFIDCVSAYAMPKCELLCPKLKFPKGTKYNCSNEVGDEIDCSTAADGSTLTFTCPKGYISNNNRVRYCKQGSWGKQKPECLAEKIEQEAATTTSGEKKLICTYASWYAYDKVFPEDLDASLCTHIVYSFAIIGREGDVRPLDSSHENIYRKFTNLKQRNKDLKILLSIGTTDGSDSVVFSDVAKDESKKSAFIRSVMNIVTTYNFDGINIEWFYPKQDDKTNYINLLQDLKEKCDERGLLLSATVRSYPDDAGYDGKKMAEILDWVTIRSYGYYGPWSTYTGQNSPLFPSSVENAWEKDHLNIEASGKSWINLGVPKSKLILSIAFYGRSFTLSEDSGRGLHIPFKGAGVGNGFLRYSEFCTNSSWISTWDDEQKSVISYYEDQWLGHENVRSVRVKSVYVKENDFLGVNVWPIDGDDVYGKCGERHPLLKQVRNGLGKNIS